MAESALSVTRSQQEKLSERRRRKFLAHATIPASVTRTHWVTFNSSKIGSDLDSSNNDASVSATNKIQHNCERYKKK